MNRLLLLFVILLFSNCKKKIHLQSNTKAFDSISYYIKSIQNDGVTETEKISNLNKANQLLSNYDNNKQKRDFLAKLSLEYYGLNNQVGFNETSKNLLSYSKTSNDTTNLAIAFRYRGKYFSDLKSFDSSFYYYLKAEKLYKNFKGQKEDYASVMLNKGIIQLNIGDYLGANLSLDISNSIFKKSNNVQKQIIALNQLGLVSNDLKEYQRAIGFFNYAIKLIKENENSDSINQLSICYNNLGLVYQNLNDFKEAKKNYALGLKNENLKKSDSELYCLLIDNYSYSKFKNEEYNDLPSLFYISLKIREKNNFNQGIVLSKIHLSEYYLNSKDTLNSKRFAEEALTLAKKSKNPSEILIALKQASAVDIKLSQKYNAEYLKINDSLQLEERKSKDRFARIQLETDEVIQKNSELEVKNRNLVLFLFGTVIIFFLLYAVRTQKMRNRELAFKQEQQATNQQIYNMIISHQEKVDATSNYEKNRMAQELHDGILSKMFGTRMNLDSLNDANDEATIAVRYNYIQELKSIEQEIREISHDLSSEKGKLINNFVSIVIELFEGQQKTFDSNLVYSIDKTIQWEKLDNTAKINLYRIIQETFQNINKYAKAKTITVSFTEDNENIVLKIEDDGIGFDTAKKKKGIGLKNMISRTEESKGIYDLASEQGKGTITTVTFPYNEIKPTQIL